MMFQRQPLTVAILAASLGLVACNSNDHDTPISTSTPTATTTVTVTPSLGKILSGRVVLRDAKTGVDLAPPKTLTPADNGVATFTVPVAKLAAPVIAAVLPTTAGKLEYADEALEKATTITVPPADANKPVLRAAASVSPNANIGVTALTESAVQQAEKAAGGLIAQNINQANAAVKNQLKLNFDVTQAPIVIGVGEFDKLVNAALDAQRRAYASYLATLAKEAQRMNSASLAPAYDMAKVLASDLSDGTLDAKQDGTALSFYNATFVNAWINWVQNFYATFAQLSNIVALNRWYGGFNIADKNSVTNFPDATPIRTENGIEEYACSGEGRIKSSSGASIYMDFVNQRGSNMNVYWLDYNTGRVSYKPNLATGQTHNQQTYVTHPWLITDNTGACVGIYRPVTASKKTITFKSNEVILDSQNAQPTTCTTGVATKFATTLSNTPYTNEQTVCFNATTTSLAFDNKTLANPVKNTVVQAPFSAYAFKDGNYSYEVIFKNNALYEINLSLASFLGQFTPLVSTPTVETCASKKLPVATLTSIADYNGDYLTQGKVTFNLNTSTAKASVQGTEANITEVCGPTVLNNGTNHVLITDKGDVTLFKTTADVYSAEGREFADKTKVFYGEKASAVTNNCSSSGVDDTLGFTNAPTDFCSFTKVTSTAITNPDTYNFFNADKKENVEITVVNNAVTSVSIENDNKYSFACGVGSFPACSGVTINTANTNTIEFVFNNTALSVVNGASQGITVKNGSLIRQTSIVQPISLAASGTASGTITNVQYNKNGTPTDGRGELVANTYEFSGDLSTAYTLKINDTIRNLRYELSNRNGKFTAVNLYSGANSATPLFVYTCDTTGDNTCLDKVSFTLGTTSTLVFNNMKMRGVYQSQYDEIMNGQVKLNP